MRIHLLALMATFAASPAQAAGGIQIPEPSNLVLFMLGLTGLLVGRQLAKRVGAPRDD